MTNPTNPPPATLGTRSGVGNFGLPQTIASTDEAQQFITFRIGDEEYGVDILSVREIRGWSDVTTLPNTPDFVLGVLNLRGIILPVFDLRRRFSMGITEPTKTHVIIIVAVENRFLGILVDGVSEILNVTADEISAVPEMDLTIDNRFLWGLAALDERMVALLNLGKLFDLDALPVEHETPTTA